MFLDDQETLQAIYADAVDHGVKWKYTRDEIKDIAVQTVMAQAWFDADLAPKEEPLASHENEDDFNRRVFG